MELLKDLDVKSIAQRLEDDDDGDYLRELMEDMDRGREEMEEALGRATDVDEGSRVRAMIDAVDSVAAMIRSLWSQRHGALPEGI
ncbi:MAG: hypothetical protein WED00_13615 [Aquisalimonadaceae bacterium]